MQLKDRYQTYRAENGTIIRGQMLQAVIRSAQPSNKMGPPFRYVVDHINVFEDGMVDCWGLVDLEGFKAKVRAGWIVTDFPAGTRVYLGESVGIHLTAADVSSHVASDDLIGQVEDVIHALRGEPTSSDLSVEAYLAYRENPSDLTRERLRQAYEAVPHHLREYLTMPDSAGQYIEEDIREILDLPDY